MGLAVSTGWASSLARRQVHQWVKTEEEGGAGHIWTQSGDCEHSIIACVARHVNKRNRAGITPETVVRALR